LFRGLAILQASCNDVENKENELTESLVSVAMHHANNREVTHELGKGTKRTAFDSDGVRAADVIGRANFASRGPSFAVLLTIQPFGFQKVIGGG
jgi:hypothetical protein